MITAGISSLASELKRYSDDRTHYVAGFLFNTARDTVVLVQKRKPEWQAGKFNGVGGKVEPGENGHQAMRREFQEEAGVDVPSWRSFCRLRGLNFEVEFFVAFGDTSKVRTVETEEIVAVPMSVLSHTPLIPNLRWLIPLALDKDNVRADAVES